jgi:hypothetical protein
VGFANVDDEEGDLVFVGFVQAGEGVSLTPEGRSRVRPEDQGDPLFPLERAEPDLLLGGLSVLAQLNQLEVGRLLSDRGGLVGSVPSAPVLRIGVAGQREGERQGAEYEQRGSTRLTWRGFG